MLEQTLSVVVPVYRAGEALRASVAELITVASSFEVQGRVKIVLDEIVLVCDNPTLSVEERDRLVALEQTDARVRTIWLSNNFGQHPATVAGIVSTNSDWVATMDEDGQHDPRYLGPLLVAAARAGRPLVYAQPSNQPPHGVLRNAASRWAKVVFRFLSGATGEFHSFRLIEGSVARSACAYVGDNVYLDVALRWSCGDAAQCPVPMRSEGAPSSYDIHRLFSHFWRLVLSNGTRPLRLTAAAGVLVALAGVVTAVVVAIRRLDGTFPEPGWTSVMVAVLVLSGGLFISLATVAEFVGFAVRNAIGKPLYVKADAPPSRALWQLQRALATAAWVSA